MVYTTNVNIVESPSLHKRKRWNKNKKKAHRKKIDITDVEKTLEQQRREERHGGALEDRESNDLLFLDVGGDKETESLDEGLPLGTDTKALSTTQFVGFKPMRNKKALNLTQLKCHNLLRGLPGAKDPLKRRQRVRTIEERRDPIVAKKKAIADEGPRGQRKRALQKKDRDEEERKRKARPTSNRTVDFGFDLWKATNASDDEDEITASYTKSIKQYFKQQTKTAAVKKPTKRKIPTSALPAVMVPDAGSSYNPLYEDHQALLKKAVKEEDTRLKKIARIERQTTAMFPSADEAPTAKTWLKEMSEGLIFNEEDIEPSGEVEQHEVISISGNIANERKTKQQRRKEQHQKDEIKKKEKLKLLKMQQSQVYNVKSIMREMKTIEKLQEMNRDKRKRRKAMEPYKTKKLSNVKFEEDDRAVALGDELPDSLRKLQPHGNLLEEHFKSLQRRNIIEPRVRNTQKRKYKLKVQVKRSHRVPYEDLRKTNV